MSERGRSSRQNLRNRALASVAAVAIVASGALGLTSRSFEPQRRSEAIRERYRANKSGGVRGGEVSGTRLRGCHDMDDLTVSGRGAARAALE